MQGPDFICIGAQKAGTSWLYYTLKECPDVEFPGEKEVHFWDMHYDRGIKWYTDLFDNSKCITGDITPAYAIMSKAKIQEIKSLNSDLKIIYILRNPVERAWSHAKMDAVTMLNSNATSTPLDIKDLKDSYFLKHFASEESLHRGDYATCIINWMKIFNKEQIKIVFFEDILNNPKELALEIALFIGADRDFLINQPDSWFTRTQNKGIEQSLPLHLRQHLIGLYKDKIDRASALLNIDLSKWYEDNYDIEHLEENNRLPVVKNETGKYKSHLTFDEISNIHSSVHKKGYGSISAGDAYFLQNMINMSRPEKLLEVGTASGISTGFIALFMHNTGGKKLLSIDPSTTFYVDRTKPIGFLANKIYNQKEVDVQFINIDGSWCLYEDHNQSQSYFDCAFIDANHQHPWPTLDMIAVMPLLAAGGLVALHDLSLYKNRNHYTGIGPKYLYDQIKTSLLNANMEKHGGNIFYIQVPDNYRELENSIVDSLYLPWTVKCPINNSVLSGYKKIIEIYWSKTLLSALDEAIIRFNRNNNLN